MRAARCARQRVSAARASRPLLAERRLFASTSQHRVRARRLAACQFLAQSEGHGASSRTSLPGPMCIHSCTPPGLIATLWPSPSSLLNHARDAGRRSRYHQKWRIIGMWKTTLVASAWHEPTVAGRRSMRLLQVVGRAVGSTPCGSRPTGGAQRLRQPRTAAPQGFAGSAQMDSGQARLLA